jgi:tetratricopeptide (TPR) repeat protein
LSSALEQHRERFAADAGEIPSFEALEEHEFLSGEWENLAALYRHRLTAPDLESQPRIRVEILFRLGQTLEERCDRPEDAMSCYREAAALNPRYTPVLRQLRRMYAAREQWELVLQFAELEAETLSRPSDRAALDAEMASVWLGQLNEPNEALTLFERCLAADPANPRGLAGRAEVLETLDRTADAAQAWSRVVNATRGRERASALLRLARLAEGPLEQPERAIELYRRALTDDPQSEEAIEALAAAASAREQWTLLADLDQRRFELAAGAERRANIAAELGRLHLEKLNDLPSARSWFAQGIELRPDDVELHRGMADVARGCDDREALVASLDRIAELSDGSASPEMLLEAASLHSEQHDDEAALARLRRALEGAPESVEVLDELAAVLRRTDGHEELVDVLERRVALIEPDSDPEQRARSLAELGALHEERLQDLEASCDAYERAFEMSPSTSGIASALERIYRKNEQWDRLHEFLVNALGSVDTGERIHLLCALGGLLAERFGDTQGAMSRYEEALTLEPTAESALQGLLKLALRSGDADAILHAYTRQARAAHEPERLAEIVPDLVKLLEERGKLDEALGWSERFHDALPDDPRALEDCARLHAKLGNTDERITALEQLDGLLSGSVQAEHRRHLAQLYLELNRESDAIDALQAALESDPRDRAALEGLVAPLEQASRFAELASVKRRLSELLPPPERSVCERELADILADKLGDLDDAIVVLWRLAAEHPGVEIDERLDSLLERAGRFEELSQHLLERRSRRELEAGEDVELDLRRADLLHERLGRFDEAVLLYREIRARDPESTAALEGMERALRKAGDSSGLADLLSERSSHESDRAERAKIDLERARLLHEEIGRTAEARELYATLVDDETDLQLAAEARGRLVHLLEQEMDYPALFDCLRAGLGRGSRSEDAALHRRLADLARDRLQDPERAVSHLEAATELNPGDPELWESLSALYEAEQRSTDLLNALEAALALELEPEQELRLRVRAARVCAGELDQPERAFTHYSRARELDPAHPDAIEYLAAGAESDGRWRELSELLEARLAALATGSDPADIERRSGLRLRLAPVYAGPLEKLDAARAVLEATLAEVGPEARVTEPLADIYHRLDRSNDLLLLCKRAIQACDEPAERAVWHRRAGDALATHGDDEQAAKAYARALADLPGDRAAEEALRTIHRRRGEAAPLARLIELELSRVAGSAEIPLRLELATLLAGPLKRSEDAVVQLRRVLEIDPGCDEALTRALELSEALKSARRFWRDKRPSSRVRSSDPTTRFRCCGARSPSTRSRRRFGIRCAPCSSDSSAGPPCSTASTSKP